MINQDFIFSNKTSYRFRRHVAFWFCWWLYIATTHAANPMGKPEISYFRNLPFTLSEAVLMLIPQIVLTYYLLYFVTTNFLFKNRYWAAVAWAIPGWFISVLFTIFLISNVNAEILSFFLPEKYLQNTSRPPAVNFFMGLMLASKGAMTVAGIAVAIKFIKHWYLKEQRNLELQRENSEAQLMLLTAQVHPHFLFNTLNNIYSQIQTESPKGSKMILELSDMLRYILAEGNKINVPLLKEIEMIHDYINLEKVRYGNKLEIHLSLPEETGNLQIAPLLLLPFVENCFKHGTYKFLSNPWINLKIEIKENNLYFKLINGKEVNVPKEIPKSGTGIPNVKKRLNLLYPGKHKINISDDEDVFVVNLWLQLMEAEADTSTLIQSKPAIKYGKLESYNY